MEPKLNITTFLEIFVIAGMDAAVATSAVYWFISWRMYQKKLDNKVKIAFVHDFNANLKNLNEYFCRTYVHVAHYIKCSDRRHETRDPKNFRQLIFKTKRAIQAICVLIAVSLKTHESEVGGLFYNAAYNCFVDWVGGKQLEIKNEND